MSKDFVYTSLIIECNGEITNSDDVVDLNKDLDYNINELYINRFDPEDIVEVLNITLFRVAQCLAPLGLDFPEFN